jgi:hypothetical protein
MTRLLKQNQQSNLPKQQVSNQLRTLKPRLLNSLLKTQVLNQHRMPKDNRPNPLMVRPLNSLLPHSRNPPLSVELM